MVERMAFCDIFCGINGTGKTTLLRKTLLRLMQAGNRVLIITPHIEEWGSVPEVHPKHRHHIATYTGVRKITIDFDDDSNSWQDDVRQYFRNGVLVLDDSREYIEAQSNKFQKWLKIGRRQKGVDLFAIFHGLTQVPPEYFTFASHLFLFYTKDNIKRRSEYICDSDFTMIQEAKKRIEAAVEQGDRYYYELLTLDKRF